MADLPCDLRILTALTGYFTSPLLLTVLTASIASTAIVAKKSESLTISKSQQDINTFR